jgi:serine/threonine-protein kinase SRPK3
VGGLSAEYNVFRRIESANPRHPGFAHCLSIQRCFILRSSAGGHICFATDVLGPNMMTLRSAQPNQTFPVSVAKRIIKQILLSVDYLHRECGYVHTGNLLYPRSLTWSTKKLCLDIKADNVLASLPDPIVSQIDKYIEDHQSATCDNLKPSYQIMKSNPLTNFNLDLRHLRVRLIDYGEGEKQ